MIKLISIISLSLIFSTLYASHDALSEKSGRTSNLNHAPRLLFRIVFSSFLGTIAYPDISLDTFYVISISFLAFHLWFDPCKNIFTGKYLWYLSKTSNNSDRFWSWISPKTPGVASFLVEGVILAIVLWSYIKTF